MMKHFQTLLLVFCCMAVSGFCSQIKAADGVKASFLVVGPNASTIANGSTSNPDYNARLDESKWEIWTVDKINRFQHSDGSYPSNAFIIWPKASYKYVSYVQVEETGNPWFLGSVPYYNFSLYLMDVRDTVRAIYDSGNPSSIYISMPRFQDVDHSGSGPGYYPPGAIQAFMRDVKAQVITTIGSGGDAFWNNRIKGFYIPEENYEGCVDINSSSCNASHSDTVDYFREVRRQMEGGKELIWSPHSGVVSLPSINHVSTKLKDLLAWQNENGTLIFDRIFLQPGWGPRWRDYNQNCTDCLSLTVSRVENQNVDGVPTGATSLGAVFEMDPWQAGVDYWCFLQGLRDQSYDLAFWLGTPVVIENWVNPFYAGVTDEFCNGLSTED